MKIKRLLLFLLNLGLILPASYAQSGLTNAQVYDFAVGDVLLTRNQIYSFGSSNPPVYTTHTVLSRTTSLNNDTLIYVMKKETYIPAACMSCNPTYYLGTDTFYYSNLDSLALHYNQTTCLAVADTFFLAYCNKLVWERHAVIDTGCFEPLTHTTQFVAGLGGPYSQKIDPMGPIFINYDLLAYRKAQDSCGTLLGITALAADRANKINVYPNPAHSQIQLQGADEFIQYDILDFSGKLYQNGFLSHNRIELSNLKQGTYLLNLYNKEFKVITKLVQKL